MADDGVMADDGIMADEGVAEGTESNTMSQRDIFPFFKLPRELRDSVYDECCCTRRIRASFWEPELNASGVASPHLFAVSRQFAEEYTLRVEKYAPTLDISEVDIVTPEPFKLPRVYCRKVAVLKLNIWTPGLDYLTMSGTWVESVLSQMKGLQSVYIRLACDSNDSLVSAYAEELNSSFWTRIPKLAGLRAHMYVESDNPDWGLVDEMPLIMEWSRETGEVEDLTESESEG